MTDKPMTATEVKCREVEALKVLNARLEALWAPIIERTAKVLERDRRKQGANG